MNVRTMASLLFVATTSVPLAVQSAETPREKVVSSEKHPIPKLAGKNLVASVVDYQPGAKSPSHRHPGSNCVYARVLAGAVRSQVNDEPAKVYRAGESWVEPPDAHHKVSENASASEPAQLFVIFVADANSRTLIVPDPK
jgi:quercetin dioxygenase-like cupin family protein